MSKIILFGDSILGGYENGQLTPAITNRLRKKFPKDQILNFSIPGGTTDAALEIIDSKIIANRPNLVILNFGVNDAAVGYGMSAGKFNNNLNTIVGKIGAKKIIIISPSYTNWKVAKDQSWPRILQFELVTEHIGQEYNLPYLPLAEKMRQTKKPNSLLQADGIHFNDLGNQLLVDNLVPLIQKFQEKNTSEAKI